MFSFRWNLNFSTCFSLLNFRQIQNFFSQTSFNISNYTQIDLNVCLTGSCRNNQIITLLFIKFKFIYYYYYYSCRAKTEKMWSYFNSNVWVKLCQHIWSKNAQINSDMMIFNDLRCDFNSLQSATKFRQ